MAIPLRNFSQHSDTLIATQRFYTAVSRVCADGSHRAGNPRDERQLAFLSHATRRLAETLKGHRRAHLDGLANAFIQYTPEDGQPGSEDLELLAARCADVPAALQLVVDSTDRFIAVHRQLARRASTPEAADLHDGCCALLDTWRKHLSKAYVQDADL